MEKEGRIVKLSNCDEDCFISSLVTTRNHRTYRFLTGFYRLGDMPNEFQRVMDLLLKDITFTNCYIDDILIASKGSLKEHKAILLRF